MYSSFYAFVEKLIDFAGLFPPAKLSLDRAVKDYSEYIRGKDAWMLSRFICPTTQLPALKPLMTLFESNYPLILSVLTVGERHGKNILPILSRTLKILKSLEVNLVRLVRLRL
jgi:hypothetical protein